MPKLIFIELPPIYRQMGSDKIPPEIIARGYTPEIGPQVAVFGEPRDLEKWREEQGLSANEFPVHPARMGTHIDVYGVDVQAIIKDQPLTDIAAYIKSIRNT